MEFKLPEGGTKIANPGHPAFRGPYPEIPDEELLKLRLRAEQTVTDHYGNPEEISDEEFDNLVKEHLDDLADDWLSNNRPPDQLALQEALDYEGDQMGHCIGGYCPNVASGRSRLFSLRDSEGKPWVSIQGSPEGKRYLKDNIYQKSGKLEELYDAKHGEGEFENLIRGSGAPGMSPSEVSLFHRSFDDDHDIVRWLLDNPKFSSLIDDAWLTPPEKALHQIKGSGKKLSTQDITPEDAPKLFPYIQDFIKEGGWNEINDLQNTGLMNLQTAHRYNQATAKPEFLQTLQEQMDQGINYMPKDELQKLYEKIHGYDAGPVYAEGGLVKTYQPNHFDDLNVFLGLDPH